MKIYKKRWMQSGIALICSLAIVLSVFPVFADNEEIKNLENQTSSLENELQGINEDILALSDEISTTEMQVEMLNGEIARTSDELADAKANEEKQYEDMKARIKYMYEHGNATLLELLFSAENMSDFLNKADFIENLSEYDRNALNELQNIHQQIEDEQKTLETQQASLTDLQSQLQSQQEQLQAKADATSTDLAAVQAKLQQAKDEEAARIAAEEEARKQAAEDAAASVDNGSGGGYDDSVINGGGISASTNDVTLLAAIIQCEAYQTYDALLAVATVIMNRVESPRFPNSIRGVIYASGQFEPVWTGRLDAVLLGEQGDELHHDDRTDGDDFVVTVARLDERLQSVRDEALFSVAAVVRHHLQHARRGAELLLEDDEVLVAEADDGVHFRALRVQLFGDGVRDGAADAAAHDRDFMQPRGVRGLAERADEIVDILAFVQVIEALGGTADDLENDGDGAPFSVEIGDREGDALPFFIDAQDDELPRLRLAGDEGRLHFHERDRRVQLSLFQNLVHNDLTVLSSLGTAPVFLPKNRAFIV